MVEFIFVVLNRVCIPDTFREDTGVLRPPKINNQNNYSQTTKVAYKNRTADGLFWVDVRGTQREYSSKLLKHSIVKSILVFKR